MFFHKTGDGGNKFHGGNEKLCQLTHFINSFSVSSSCFCLSITFSMIARSSGVRCDKSGISAMTLGTAEDHKSEELLPTLPVSSSSCHFVSNEFSASSACGLHRWTTQSEMETKGVTVVTRTQRPNQGEIITERKYTSRSSCHFQSSALLSISSINYGPRKFN